MITIKERIGYGLGDMSSSMFWKIFGMYLMIFYTDVFGIPAAVVGTMFLVTRFFDAANDPIMGIIADRTNSRHGKYRPYLLWFALPFALIGILTFYTPSVNINQKIIYAYITYIMMMIVYTIVNVPYASLLGVMSPNPKERNVLSTYRMGFAYLGSFITVLLFMPIVNQFINLGVTEQHAWTYAVAIIGLICALLFWSCFKLTKERVKPISSKKTPLREDLKDLIKNKPWWILLGAGIATLIFNSIRDGATVYYFKYYILENELGNVTLFVKTPFILSGVYLAIGQAANLIGVLISAPIANKIGKKRTFLFSMLTATILSIVFFWFDKNQLVLIFSFQFFISVCAGSIFPLLWSMYADCADYSELVSGNRATGLIFSSSSMSQKFGWAIGSALTGWILAVFGFIANVEQSASTITGIKMCLSFLPAAGAFISACFILFYPLSEKKMADISSQLAIKRSIV